MGAPEAFTATTDVGHYIGGRIVPGVSAKVDLEQKSARVELSAAVSDETLRQAVEEAGYTVTGIQ